jgi:hypothetical protein
MVEPCINPSLLPFIMSLARLLDPHNYFLQGRPKAKANIYIIVSILACFAKNMAKTIPLPRSCKYQKGTCDHRVKARARVDRFPSSSFTHAINLLNKEL